MLTRIPLIFIILLSVTSCKKVFIKLKQAEIYVTDNAGHLGMGTGKNQKLVFFEVPIDKCNFNLSGSVTVDEYNLSSGGKDYTVNYDL